MLQEVDYDRLDKWKTRCLYFAIVAIVATVAYPIMAFTSIPSWLADSMIGKRPIYTTVQVLAEEHYKMSSYATAVRINQNEAVACETSDTIEDFKKSPRINFTPVPTFTEFVISEEDRAICVMVYEYRNTDSLPKNNNALVRIRKSDYEAVFGDVPIDSKMIRLDTEKLGINTIYDHMPRSFPVQMTKEAGEFMLNLPKHRVQYMSKVQKKLDEPTRKIRGVFILIGLLGVVALTLIHYILRIMHLEYKEDMVRKGQPILKFRYFVAVRDVSRFTNEMISFRRQQLKEEHEKRVSAVRARRMEAMNESVQTPIQTPEERMLERKKKIKSWCTDLQMITPRHPSSELERTENICKEAVRLFETDGFRVAKDSITKAINERKVQNQEQRVNL